MSKFCLQTLVRNQINFVQEVIIGAFWVCGFLYFKFKEKDRREDIQPIWWCIRWIFLGILNWFNEEHGKDVDDYGEDVHIYITLFNIFLGWNFLYKNILNFKYK